MKNSEAFAILVFTKNIYKTVKSYKKYCILFKLFSKFLLLCLRRLTSPKKIYLTPKNICTDYFDQINELSKVLSILLQPSYVKRYVYSSRNRAPNLRIQLLEYVYIYKTLHSL